jgi:hypothetical protein
MHKISGPKNLTHSVGAPHRILYRISHSRLQSFGRKTNEPSVLAVALVRYPFMLIVMVLQPAMVEKPTPKNPIEGLKQIQKDL